MAKVAVIGSGFAGLSAAAYLAKAGHQVDVFEKNDQVGGRARQFSTEEGFVFDMGPSWYWMPEVFENFFNDFGFATKDFYELQLLNPGFDIVFELGKKTSIPNNYEKLKSLFEEIEPGAANALDKFMKEAEVKYNYSMKDLINKPGLSLKEFASLDIFKTAIGLNMFGAFSKHVRKYFKHPKLIAIMEFPVLFLGAMPKDTPALYSLMNYAGLKLGTWYPIGGFGKIVDGMHSVCIKQNVSFFLNSNVEQINVVNNEAKGLVVNGELKDYDAVVGAADYHHIEQKLLSNEHRNYSKKYWDKKTFAPSSLLFYVGLSKKLNSLDHHTLFFDEDLNEHALEIYKKPAWPNKPLFYVCCPSKTDSSVAPNGKENLFILMPIATNITDSEETREKYFKILLERLERHLGESILDSIEYKRSYCVNDFITDYNAYGGNAYGLANTLFQTATFKPKVKNKKVWNLFYAGQLTVPGPGVPPSIISGKIVSQLLNKTLNKTLNKSLYETVI